MTPDLVIILLYFLIVACIIYPPPEFSSAGFTIPALFSSYLGNEHENFIAYHLKRTTLTLFIYSLLPAAFILVILVGGNDDGLQTIFFAESNLLSKLILTPCFVLPIMAFWTSYTYEPNNDNHPIAKNLCKFCNNNSSWKIIASDINAEFRSIEKFSIQPNPISRIVVTANWIIKITPLSVFMAHQSDANLIVKESDTHSLSHLNDGIQEQFITIEVQSSRVETFKIRLNARDFRDLQDRVTRSITVPEEIKIHKNVVDKFIDAFKEAIMENATYTPTQELEMCLGCMQSPSNVKLQKMCADTAEATNCTTCYCKPMWCADCMGRWFAHRQDIAKVSTWLSEKCTCPMCRATFCVLDVCTINTE